MKIVRVFILTAVVFLLILLAELLLTNFFAIIPCYNLAHPGTLYPMQLHENRLCTLTDLAGRTHAPYWVIIICLNLLLLLFSGIISI